MYSWNLWHDIFSLPDKLLKYILIIRHPIINLYCNIFFYYHVSIYTKKEGAKKPPLNSGWLSQLLHDVVDDNLSVVLIRVCSDCASSSNCVSTSSKRILDDSITSLESDFRLEGVFTNRTNHL